MNKENLAEGLSKYIQNELIPNIPDISSKMILGTVSNVIKKNPNIIDSIIENPIIHSMISSEDGYDLSGMMDAIQESMNQYGNLKITIPKVPLLIPTDQVMSFDVNDIERLKQYIR